MLFAGVLILVGVGTAMYLLWQWAADEDFQQSSEEKEQ